MTPIRTLPKSVATVSLTGTLPEDRLVSLRRHHLLYDRDDNGEFLHAYTHAFDDRFFFEIVQRTGGYQGYGAVNAAVRMAAQARQS